MGLVPVAENGVDRTRLMRRYGQRALLALALDLWPRIAVTERLKRLALGGVALAHHLPQLRAAKPFSDHCEPAGSDRRKLAVIASDDHLRPVRSARSSSSADGWVGAVPASSNRTTVCRVSCCDSSSSSNGR